jgi:hypothetical protein
MQRAMYENARPRREADSSRRHVLKPTQQVAAAKKAAAHMAKKNSVRKKKP